MHNALAQFKRQRESLANHYISQKAKQETLLQQQAQTVAHKQQLQQTYEDCLLKKEILEQASTAAREEGKAIFEKVVTDALQMVFEENSSAFVKLGKKNGTPTAEVMIRSNRSGKIVETDPCGQDGGGLADIISTGIFMTNTLLLGQENKAPFFLDEPTKYVSAQHAEASAYFLKAMTDYTARQTFISTHEREYLPFVADLTHFISLDEQGISQVERFVEEGELVKPE